MFIPDSPTCFSFIERTLVAAAEGAQGWLSLGLLLIPDLPEVWKGVT